MKFTIVIPHKEGVLPTKSIESCKSQTFRDGQVMASSDAGKERVFARNEGMKNAKGEWICWLDADDYYLPYYLEVMNQATKKYPTARVFYFGGIVCWSRWDSTIRKPNEVHKGDVFRSGGIMSGGFIFKSDCLLTTGYLPEASNCYDLGRAMLKDFPEVTPLYKPGQLDLGNPWGDDWAMFYKLTREYEPQMLNVSPYVVMTREPHNL